MPRIPAKRQAEFAAPAIGDVDRERLRIHPVRRAHRQQSRLASGHTGKHDHMPPSNGPGETGQQLANESEHGGGEAGKGSTLAGPQSGKRKAAPAGELVPGRADRELPTGRRIVQ